MTRLGLKLRLGFILVWLGAASILTGCSTEAEAPPIAEQSRDLMDDDGDGVINARDKCPGTPHAAIVDNDGCPTFVERSESNDLHILFANDSTVIPDNFLSQIKRMADFLATYPEARIELKATPVQSGHRNITSDSPNVEPKSSASNSLITGSAPTG